MLHTYPVTLSQQAVMLLMLKDAAFFECVTGED